jgi:hypothetical protein
LVFIAKKGAFMRDVLEKEITELEKIKRNIETKLTAKRLELQSMLEKIQIGSIETDLMGDEFIVCGFEGRFLRGRRIKLDGNPSKRITNIYQ